MDAECDLGYCVTQDQSWVAVTPLSGLVKRLAALRSPEVVLAGGHLVPAAGRGQMC